ncbi:hypothetical protein KFK09_028178 [Dendrobium nobile]|uniref:Uncharacterized protein n=1 Tax=Dendrobium nobile TaxID=94219 RepID=A0A8T3A2P4_DENNO|nr:hypothetical protein KFK09_028178 [Dendrobium nobile]
MEEAASASVSASTSASAAAMVSSSIEEEEDRMRSRSRGRCGCRRNADEVFVRMEEEDSALASMYASSSVWVSASVSDMRETDGGGTAHARRRQEVWRKRLTLGEVHARALFGLINFFIFAAFLSFPRG